MSENNEIEELQAKVDQLQAKVFRNQNLDISHRLKNISARKQSEQISDGDAQEQNLDEKNPVILRAERDNLRLSLDPDTKKNYPTKYYQKVGRVKEIEKLLREMGEYIE